jgi:hypothetical protein
MDQIKIDNLQKKIEELRSSGKYDLSTEEDLSIAVMNLVSLEEHFFFTAEKTGKEEYFDLLQETREIRKELLGRMMDKNEGETWCISKHLLAASMRIMEVATKLQKEGKKEDAKAMFDRAYRVYSLFWVVRLKVVDLSGVKKIPEGAVNVHDKEAKGKWSVEELVEKLVHCCDE